MSDARVGRRGGGKRRPPLLTCDGVLDPLQHRADARVEGRPALQGSGPHDPDRHATARSSARRPRAGRGAGGVHSRTTARCARPAPRRCRQDDRELVGPEPARGRARRQGGAQVRGEGDEERVAGGQAVGVVDGAEAVEVRGQDADRFVGVGGGAEGGREPLLQQAARGDTRQRVAVRGLGHLGGAVAQGAGGRAQGLLQLADGGDVAADEDGPGVPAVPVEQRRRGGLDHDRPAARGHELHLDPGPRAACDELAAHGVEVLLDPVVVPAQPADVAADEVRRADAVEALGSLVEQLDDALGVDGDDGVPDVLEQPFEQAAAHDADVTAADAHRRVPQVAVGPEDGGAVDGAAVGVAQVDGAGLLRDRAEDLLRVAAQDGGRGHAEQGLGGAVPRAEASGRVHRPRRVGEAVQEPRPSRPPARRAAPAHLVPSPPAEPLPR